LKSRGFALPAVLLIVILVPIIVFGATFYITNSVTRNESQNRNMDALYLAQAGIHRGIFNLRSTGAALPVSNIDANNQINLVQVASGCGIYQLKCTGTSVSPAGSISRTVFAQYELASNKVQIYMEGDGTGIPPPPAGTGTAVYDWEFPEGSGSSSPTSGTYQATIMGNQPSQTAWVAGPDGALDYALKFNISNTHTYAWVADSSGLDLTTSGSILVRVRVDGSVGASGGIVFKGHLSNNSVTAYGITFNGGKFALELTNSGGVTTVLNSNVTPVLGTWYLVQGAWGSSGMRIYVDGVLKNSNTTVVTVRNTTGTLQFGTKYTNNASGKEPISIDEVKIGTGC